MNARTLLQIHSSQMIAMLMQLVRISLPVTLVLVTRALWVMEKPVKMSTNVPMNHPITVTPMQVALIPLALSHVNVTTDIKVMESLALNQILPILLHITCLSITFTLNKVGEEFFMQFLASPQTIIVRKANVKKMVLFCLFQGLQKRIISFFIIAMEKYGLVLMISRRKAHTSIMMGNQSLGPIGGERTVDATLMILMTAKQEMLLPFTDDIGIGWAQPKSGVMLIQPNDTMSCALSTWMTKYDANLHDLCKFLECEKSVKLFFQTIKSNSDNFIVCKIWLQQF